MARIVKVFDKRNHAICMRDDLNVNEMLLVKGSKRTTYVWVGRTGTNNDRGCLTFSGRVVLRKFALALLEATK